VFHLLVYLMIYTLSSLFHFVIAVEILIWSKIFIFDFIHLIFCI